MNPAYFIGGGIVLASAIILFFSARRILNDPDNKDKKDSSGETIIKSGNPKKEVHQPSH